jgi:hypothetical protein
VLVSDYEEGEEKPISEENNLNAEENGKEFDV